MEGKAGTEKGRAGCDMTDGRWRRRWELFLEGERGARGVGGIRWRVCERRGRKETLSLQSPSDWLLKRFFIQCYDYPILCRQLSLSTIPTTRKSPTPNAGCKTHACVKVPSLLTHTKISCTNAPGAYNPRATSTHLKVLIESEIPPILMFLLLLPFLIFLLRASHNTSFLVITDALFEEVRLPR